MSSEVRLILPSHLSFPLSSIASFCPPFCFTFWSFLHRNHSFFLFPFLTFSHQFALSPQLRFLFHSHPCNIISCFLRSFVFLQDINLIFLLTFFLNISPTSFHLHLSVFYYFFVSCFTVFYFLPFHQFCFWSASFRFLLSFSVFLSIPLTICSLLYPSYLQVFFSLLYCFLLSSALLIHTFLLFSIAFLFYCPTNCFLFPSCYLRLFLSFLRFCFQFSSYFHIASVWQVFFIQVI